MKTRRMVLGVLVALLMGSLLPGATLVVAEAEGQTAGGVSGRAFGASVSTPTASLPASPLATLPVAGGMGDAELASVDVLNTLKAKGLSAISTGVVGENASSAQSMAALSDVNVLNGVITAKAVLAMASSASNGARATSTDAGSTIVDLVVNGVSMGVVTPAPNTQISLPGVGAAILNEQAAAGDGITDSGLRVVMIHVVLKDALTGAKTGEIVVGAADSYAKFVR